MADGKSAIEVRIKATVDKELTRNEIDKAIKQIEKKLSVKMKIDSKSATNDAKKNAKDYVNWWIKKVDYMYAQQDKAEKKMNKAHANAHAENIKRDKQRQQDYINWWVAQQDRAEKKISKAHAAAHAENIRRAKDKAEYERRMAQQRITQEEKLIEYKTKMENKSYGLTSSRAGKYLTREQKAELKELDARIKELTTDTPRLRHQMVMLDQQFKRLNTSAQNVARNSLGFGEALRNAFTKFPIWITTATIIMGTLNTFKEGIRYIVEMDTALTNLAKVTTFTKDELVDMKDAAIELGQELGRSSVEIMKAFAEFGRVAKVKEDIVELAESAVLLSNVTTLTSDSAAKSINTTMIAFKLGVEDAIRLVDQFNELQNNFRYQKCGIKIYSNIR